MTELSQETKDRLIYAFGHMVAAHDDSPHASDSDDEAKRAIIELFDIDVETMHEDDAAMLAIGVMLTLAEHVAEHYEPGFEALP